jgi:hypothetical protein
METMHGLIGTLRESNTQNSPRLCAVRPGYTAFEMYIGEPVQCNTTDKERYRIDRISLAFESVLLYYPNGTIFNAKKKLFFRMEEQ